MASKPKAERTREPGAAAHPKHKVHAFWPVWLGGPLTLGLGDLAHNLWGADLPAAALVPLVFVLVTGGLSALTHRYAAARNEVQRWHAVLSVAVLGLSLTAVEMFGTAWWPLSPLGQVVLGTGVVLALSWNIRRLEIVRGAGQDNRPEDSADKDWHGLKRPRKVKVTDSTDGQTVAQVTLSAGQTAKDVEAALGAMGSDLGTVTNGIRVVKGEREGEVELTLLWEDQLTDAVGWDGPDHVGGSIADPISLGINENKQPVLLRLAGDYDNGVAPGHLAIVGMPRTGKGIGVIVVWTNLRGRRDVFPVINDAAKGEQMLMFLRPGMPKGKAWIDKSEAGAKVQATAIFNAISARNKALGDAGYSSWTPEAFSKGFEWNGQHIHMPALVFHIEEFAPIGIASPNLFTKIAEQGLSAGVFCIFSLQRASHDRFPTSLRSVIGNGICYGAFSDIDVSFALSDDVTSGGATPADWKQKYPGRAMAELNGQDDGMARIPFKTHFARSMGEFDDYVKETMAHLGRLAPDLDPCTAEAFGQPYQDYLTGETTTTSTDSADPIHKAAEPIQKATAPTTSANAPDPDDEPDEDEMDDDPNESEYVKRPMPPEFDLAGVDPHQPLTSAGMEHVDLTPPPVPGRQMRHLDAAEKRVLFREILQRLADEGELDVTTGRLIEIWQQELGHPASNQGPTVSRYIVDAAAEDLADGQPNDLMGCLERRKRGRYHITIRPRVAAMNGYHA